MNLVIITREELVCAASRGETVGDVARSFGVPTAYVRGLSVGYGVLLFTDAQKRWERLALIRKLADAGYTRREIARAVSLSCARVGSIVGEAGISVKRQPDRRSDPERDAAIVKDGFSGMSLEKIGRRHNLTRERVRQILKREGFAPVRVVPGIQADACAED